MNKDFSKYIDDLANAVRQLGKAFGDICTALGNLSGSFCKSIATPKEWYLLKHAKKWRTRKKYQRRLKLRLMKIATEYTDEWPAWRTQTLNTPYFQEAKDE